MSRSTIMLGLLAAALVAVPQGADAQSRPQTRDGFFIGFGVGGGTFGCSVCGTEREGSLTGHLKLGGTVSPRLLLGVESSAWTKEEGGVRLTHGNVSALAQFYPSATAGFYLSGGVGLSRLAVDVSGGGGTVTVTENGLGLTAGLGYDVRLGTNFSLTPYGLFGWGDFEGGSADTFQLGLGVTWH